MYQTHQASNFIWKPKFLCCQNSYLTISFTSHINSYILMNGKMKKRNGSSFKAMHFYSPLPSSSSLLLVFPLSTLAEPREAYLLSQF